MNAPAFKALYEDFGEIRADDAVLAALAQAYAAQGGNPEAFNSVVNSTLRRALDSVKESGKPLDMGGLAKLFAEQAQHVGMAPEAVTRIVESVQPVLQKAVSGDLPAATDDKLTDDGHLLELETWLDGQLEAGKLTRREYEALFQHGQDIEGVKYLTALKAFSEGQGEAPAQPEALTRIITEVATMQDDNHYPTVNPPLETPEAKATREAADSVRLKKQACYALKNDPRYHQSGPEGEIFRAEADRQFQETFGDAPAGTSEAGLGV